MKCHEKLIVFILVLVFMTTGCASLHPFTGISFVEIVDENTKIYHVRYPGYVTLNTEVGPEIYRIEGVQGVRVIPYQCIVVKSPAYKWEEIEHQIKTLLVEFEVNIREKYQKLRQRDTT